MALLNVRDYALAAAERLDAATYDYYAGGAQDQLTLNDNAAAYNRLRLCYRVLAGVTEADLSTSILGHALAAPIAIAPTAFHRLAHPDGEAGSARAASGAGALFVLSSLSNTAMEEVFAATTAPGFFQLYVYKDRGITRDLIARAEAAGAQAIVLTVDAPVWGLREADARNQFTLPADLAVANLAATGKSALPGGAGSGLASYMAEAVEGGLTWADLDTLCATTHLPVVVKGICHPEDGRLAAAHGAAAIVVSNHGGRQLDGAPATVDALPAVVAAVDGACEVWIDGGITRGSDVFKALALGARCVFVGRPVLWGLAVAGCDGVAAVLAILRRELANTMALCGCASIADIHRGYLFEPGAEADARQVPKQKKSANEKTDERK